MRRLRGRRCRRRRTREILLLDTRSLSTYITLVNRRLLRAADHVLRLAAVILDRALARLHRFVGVLSGKVADLRSLLVDQVLGIGDVGVDELAVLDVNQRDEVRKGGEEEG